MLAGSRMLNLSEPPLPVFKKTHCGKLKGSTRKIDESLASSPRKSLEADTLEKKKKKRTNSELGFAGFLHSAELVGRGDSQSGRRLPWPFRRDLQTPTSVPRIRAPPKRKVKRVFKLLGSPLTHLEVGQWAFEEPSDIRRGGALGSGTGTVGNPGGSGRLPDPTVKKSGEAPGPNH